MAEPVAQMPHMPEYGVRPGTWEPLPWSWAAERLLACRNFWVVTASAGGRPHALPVWGVWDDDEHRFFFSSAPHARRIRNLAANRQVVVAVDSTVEVVSVEGRAALVTDDDRRRTWARRYLDKYLSLAPDLTEEFVLGGAVVEVVPEKVLSVIERADEFATRPTRWVFDA